MLRNIPSAKERNFTELRVTLVHSCLKLPVNEETSTWIGPLWFRLSNEQIWRSSSELMTPERVIVEAAYAFACSLPCSTVETIATAILNCPLEILKAEISRLVPHHQHRDLAIAFVDRWQREGKELDGRTVAIALQTAALSQQAYRDSQSIELVWTGPDTERSTFRRTHRLPYKFWIQPRSGSRLLALRFIEFQISAMC